MSNLPAAELIFEITADDCAGVTRGELFFGYERGGVTDVYLVRKYAPDLPLHRQRTTGFIDNDQTNALRELKPRDQVVAN